MQKRSKYFSYRYFLVSASKMRSLFPKSKKEVVQKLKSNLQTKVKISEKYKHRKYLLYFIEELTKDLYLLKLARKRDFNKYQEGDNDIETVEEISHRAMFWKLVDESSKIFSMQLNLRAPNLFGNRYEANQFLKEEQEISIS